MITQFQDPQPTEPETRNHLQWNAALGAGFIAGLVLLIVPRGSPWSTITFFVPTIVGRVVPETWNLALMGAVVIHLGVSLIYGLAISLVVSGIREMRAVLAGGVMGLVLYFINLGVVYMLAPGLRGNEAAVIFTHIVFGLIAGGAYRGLLRRRAASTDETRR